MYHAEQDSHNSDSDANEVAENNNDQSSVLSVNTSANEEANSSTNRNPNKDPQEPSTDQPSNQWTEFEHQHKGEGKTSSELSEMYHQQEEQQQPQKEETMNNVEEDASQSTTNEWNTFQHQHKDENLTHEQISAMYHQQQQQNPTVANAQEDAANAQEDASQSTTNAWNTFQHQYKDENLTHEQMSALYHQQQQQTPTAANAQEDAS